jgi:hypothetical protein
MLSVGPLNCRSPDPVKGAVIAKLVANIHNAAAQRRSKIIVEDVVMRLEILCVVPNHIQELREDMVELRC